MNRCFSLPQTKWVELDAGIKKRKGNVVKFGIGWRGKKSKWRKIE